MFKNQIQCDFFALLKNHTLSLDFSLKIHLFLTIKVNFTVWTEVSTHFLHQCGNPIKKIIIFVQKKSSLTTEDRKQNFPPFFSKLIEIQKVYRSKNSVKEAAEFSLLEKHPPSTQLVGDILFSQAEYVTIIKTKSQLIYSHCCKKNSSVIRD